MPHRINVKTSKGYKLDEVYAVTLRENWRITPEALVKMFNIFQYTCKELFMVDLNLERCKEDI